MSTIPRTQLAFQHDAKLNTLKSTIQSVAPASTLSEANLATFKGLTPKEKDFILIIDKTLFHPQGGGQPSDTGTITHDATETTFTVTAVRTAPTGQVLHLGTFTSEQKFSVGDTVTQHLDVEKRTLYSRYHTAGHVLGSAVRHLLGDKIPNFDELKASHFPDSASCEFAGLIDGKHKDAIQTQVDEFVARDMPVEIEFWTEDKFREEGLERLIPDRALADDGLFRVVRIRGAEVYPCGGTHVDSTRFVEGTRVRKIARQKGMSKVSYVVG